MGNPNSYRATNPSSDQIVGLMRRVNALESDVSIGFTNTLNWGGSGTGDGQFTQVGNIAIDTVNEWVYVGDYSADRIQKFAYDGTFILKFGSTGTGNGQFDNPRGMAVDSSGNLYVVDTGNARVQKFNSSGTYLSQLDISLVAVQPVDIALDEANGKMYISDLNLSSVRTYSLSTGAHIALAFPAAPDLVVQPYSMRIDLTAGVGHCVDRGPASTAPRVGTWSLTTGAEQASFGSYGTGDSEFIVPFAVDIDEDGMFYVADVNGTSSYIKLFTAARAFHSKFGSGAATISNDAVSGIVHLRVIDSTMLYVTCGTYFVKRFTYAAPYTQTTFTRYERDSTSETLGTPDAGVSVPVLTALNKANNAELDPYHLTDIRAAIQALAPYYKNAVTGVAFNWTDASANNLYYVAMGNRTKYGATGGAKYTWTRTRGAMLSDGNLYDIDIGELEECIAKLEASNLV